MSDRYTIAHVEARAESVNRRLESLTALYRIHIQQSNGYTNIYEFRADDETKIRHIIGGTKREIAHYLSAMMTGIDLATRRN